MYGFYHSTYFSRIRNAKKRKTGSVRVWVTKALLKVTESKQGTTRATTEARLNTVHS